MNQLQHSVRKNNDKTVFRGKISLLKNQRTKAGSPLDFTKDKLFCCNCIHACCYLSIKASRFLAIPCFSSRDTQPLLPKQYFAHSSVHFSHSIMSNSLWPHEQEHASHPRPSPTPGVYPNSHSLSQWCHPTISSSAVPFSSCPQSFPASGSFQMSQLFISGGQSIGVSASTSVLPMDTQDWSLLGWTGWISLQSKGLSRVFSNTTVQKHQLFSAQLYVPTLLSIHDYWENHSFN